MLADTDQPYVATETHGHAQAAFRAAVIGSDDNVEEEFYGH